MRACHTARGCVPLGDVSAPILSVGCRERPSHSRNREGVYVSREEVGQGDTRQQGTERGHTSAEKGHQGTEERRGQQMEERKGSKGGITP